MQTGFNETKAIQLMKKEGLDAVVVTSPENVTYATGFLIPSQRIIPERLAIAVIPIEGKAALITSTIEENLAKKNSKIRELETYVDRVTSPMDALFSVLRRKKLDQSRIGLEKRHLAAIYYEELLKLMPRATVVDGAQVFDEMRSIKNCSEIEVLREAAGATEDAVIKGFASTRERNTEAALARNIKRYLNDVGAMVPHHLTVSAGPNTFLLHHTPGLKKLQSGEPIYIDAGAVFELGYLSDMGLTGIVGRPSSGQAQMYKKLVKVHRETISLLKPGMQVADLYKASQRLFEREGIPSGRQRLANIGHGLGLSTHERPIVNAVSGDTVEASMVICVEEDIESSRERFHVEDTVLVTKHGPQYLTRHSESGEMTSLGK